MNFVVSIIMWLGQYSVILMLVVFALIAVTTYWPGRKQRFERDGRMIFDDER